MKIILPKGSCDTHMHFYDTKKPGAPGTFLPGDFSAADYMALQKKLGLERVIVVQPNAYADDNSMNFEAMRRFGKNARGVAVVKPTVADAELERLTREGARAVRIMTLSGGMLGFNVMDAVVARVHPFGWHANIQLDGRDLPKYEAQIRKLPGKFVIDHTGKFLEPVAAESKEFRSLLNLLDTGRCWVKLSAPYETSKTGAPEYEDVSKLVRALVKHAPQRMLWALNWPHPGNRKPAPPDDVALCELLLDWAPSEKDRQRMLVDNPAELYGF